MAERERRGWFARLATFVVLLAAALLLLRFLGPGGRPATEPPPPSPAGGKGADAPVRGRVLGPRGAPIRGAEVEGVLEVPGEEKPRTLRAGPTGEDGRFDLGPLPAERGRLRLRVVHGPLSVEADLTGAEGPVALDLTLPESFTVGGVVVSAEEGRPLSGIEVRWGGVSTRTDALGRFTFANVTAEVLADPLPDLELSGAGRRPHRRPLPRDRGLDDLLIRMDRE